METKHRLMLCMGQGVKTCHIMGYMLDKKRGTHKDWIQQERFDQSYSAVEACQSQKRRCTGCN